jgi:hypothetical protein
VFEVRSIGVKEHLYTLLELSIDSLGFARSWLIRSIFGAMVWGSMLMIIDSPRRRYAIEIIGVRYLPEYPTDDEVRESFLVLKFDV